MLRYNLYFKNLPHGTQECELLDYFGQFGEIKSLKLMRKRTETTDHPPTQEEHKGDKPEGESLGFGFVSFTTIEAASRARAESKVKPFKNQTLFIS